jgi:hypothetical protein
MRDQLKTGGVENRVPRRRVGSYFAVSKHARPRSIDISMLRDHERCMFENIEVFFGLG